MCKDGFYFFTNYRNIARDLSPELKAKFLDALMDYAIDGIEPEDCVIKALITAIKPSLDKVEKRGGNHNPTGQNQHKEVKVGQSWSNEVKSGQSEDKVGQSGQSFNKQETRNKKQEDIIIISNDMIVKNDDFDVPKINLVLNNHNLAEIKKLTPERKTKLKQRCNDVGGFDEFLRQMDTALKESSFLRGDNKNGWKADFDFFLQKSSWQKAIEGGYQDSKPFEQGEVQQQKEREERQRMIEQYWEGE